MLNSKKGLKHPIDEPRTIRPKIDGLHWVAEFHQYWLTGNDEGYNIWGISLIICNGRGPGRVYNQQDLNWGGVGWSNREILALGPSPSASISPWLMDVQPGCQSVAKHKTLSPPAFNKQHWSLLNSPIDSSLNICSGKIVFFWVLWSLKFNRFFADALVVRAFRNITIDKKPVLPWNAIKREIR